MRKLLSLTLLVVVAAVALSGPRVSAVPADPEVPQLSRLLAQRAGSHGGGGRRGGGGAPSQCDVVGFLTGRVTSVDVATSAVTVQTATGSLTAGFPDTTVSTAKPGDDVLVGITLINTRTATIGGSVARLDQANGEVMIQTVSGPLLVRFPTRAIQGLRQGDEVLLKLDLTTASRPFPATSPEVSPQPKPDP